MISFIYNLDITLTEKNVLLYVTDGYIFKHEGSQVLAKTRELLPKILNSLSVSNLQQSPWDITRLGTLQIADGRSNVAYEARLFTVSAATGAVQVCFFRHSEFAYQLDQRSLAVHPGRPR